MRINYIICLPSYLNVYNVVVFRNVNNNLTAEHNLELSYDSVEYFVTSKKFKSIIYDEYSKIPGIIFNTSHNRISTIFNKIFNSDDTKTKKVQEFYMLLYIGDYITHNIEEDNIKQTILYNNIQLDIPTNVNVVKVYKNGNSIKKQRLLDLILNSRLNNIDGEIEYIKIDKSKVIDKQSIKNLKFLLAGQKLTKAEKKILFA